MKRAFSADDQYEFALKNPSINRLNRETKLEDADMFQEFIKRDPNDQPLKISQKTTRYPNDSKDTYQSQALSKNTKPFLLKRLVSAMMLLAFMMIICFSFDLLEDYNFLSLSLGFVACILFQVKVLQYIFKKEMFKMQLDQYGALRAKIKYLFGELNPSYVDQKNRKKYYHHVLSPEDKLFDKKNQDIYHNTMQSLISKSKFNHIDNIRKIHRKWQIILIKYQIMINFVKNFMNVHSARAKIFTAFIGTYLIETDKINNTFTPNDYQIWQKVLQTHEKQKEEDGKNSFEGIERFLKNRKSSQGEKAGKSLKDSMDFTDVSISEDGFSVSENNTFVSADFKKQLMHLKNQSQHPITQSKDMLGWKQLVSFLEQRNKTNIRKQNYMKQSVFDELKLISDQAKGERDANFKQLESVKIKYEQNIKAKQEIQSQINKLKSKIDQLSSIILTKKRTTENNQEICKMELDIRIKKVEIENFQVKAAFFQDLIKRTTFQLYIKCRDINKQLETRTLSRFNNRLSNYINRFLEYEMRSSEHIFKLINQYQEQKVLQKQQNQNPNSFLEQFKIFAHGQNLSVEILNNQSFSDLYEMYRTRQKSEHNMKEFFEEMKRFYKEICLNLESAVKVIEQAQAELFQKANDGIAPNSRNINFSTDKDKLQDHNHLTALTTNYTANLFYDRYFLNTLASLSRKDQKVFNHSVKVIEKQGQIVHQYLELTCQPSVLIVQKIVQKYNKADQQIKKLQKNKSKNFNPDEYTSKRTQHENMIAQVKSQLISQIKKKQNLFVYSVINELTKQLIEKHYKICEYILIHEKKSFHFEAPTQKEEQEQNRNIKFKQYQLYVLKVEKNNFDDPMYESLSRNNENHRQQIKKKPLISQAVFKPNIIPLKPEPKLETISREKHFQSKEESLKMLNRILGVLFQEWSNSQFFHDLIKEELELSLNFKRPGIVEPLRISHLKVQQKTKQSGFEDLVPHSTQMYRCLFDVKINFKGKIAVHIASRLNFGNRTHLNIQLLIKQFRCPIRICFNPFSVGKSYVSLLQRPHLNIEYDVKIGDWHINRIPFFSQIVKIFIVLKLRKKMLWPKKITLSIPLAYKNPLGVAIRERILFENEKRKSKSN